MALDASERCSAPLLLSLAMDAGLSQGDRGCKREHPSYRCGFLFLCVFALFLISIPPSSSLCFSLKLASPTVQGNCSEKADPLGVATFLQIFDR